MPRVRQWPVINGLTFAGLVYGIDQRASLVLDMLAGLTNYFTKLWFRKMTYKAVTPYISPLPRRRRPLRAAKS